MRYIELHNIHKVYKTNSKFNVHALKGISLQIEKGDMVAFMGVKGSGKTSLMHIIACIDTYTEGNYSLDGVDISTLSKKQLAVLRNEKVGYMSYNYGLNNNQTVRENVALPLYFSKNIAYKDINKRVEEALKKVGIDLLDKKKIKELTVTQMLRVGLARAIVNSPDILLIDEITAILDPKNTKEIIAILRKLNKDGLTIILATHDMREANECHYIIYLDNGVVE